MTRFQRGLTLPGMMVAISIAAILSFGGFGIYHWFELKTAAAYGKNTVEEMRTALHSYYQVHCRDVVFPAVSTANLISEGFLPLGRQLHHNR